MGNSWKTYGQLVKNRIPNASQPQSAERAERSEASEALQFAYAFRRSEMPPDTQKCFQTLRKASRCSEMPPDVHKCFQTLTKASRCSEMLPDAQKCIQTLRKTRRCSELFTLAQNCVNSFKQILSMAAKCLNLNALPVPMPRQVPKTTNSVWEVPQKLVLFGLPFSMNFRFLK